MSLFKIGDISKLCNISIKALRYYEELGLIKPANVDAYTGYRYYDQENIEHLYTIQLLKDLNFSLDEIKNYNSSSLDKKYVQIKKEIKELKKKLNLISSLKIQKGENIMKCFVNDEQAIGKWEYVCSAINRDSFNMGETFIDEDVLMKELYFLPNGEGYWFMDRWTQGIIYHFAGRIMKYNIEGEKLYLEIYDDNQELEIMLVFKKFDNKEYSKNDIEIQDDVDMPFICDNDAVGYYEAVDFISYEDKENYKPNGKKEGLFLKSITLNPNGDCFREFNDNDIVKIHWTKNYLLQKVCKLASNYILKNIDGETYLITDWKSGDYVYGKTIQGCYVFKKITTKTEPTMEK
jgi:DNA-binding transcriptional MerR regulator